MSPFPILGHPSGSPSHQVEHSPHLRRNFAAPIPKQVHIPTCQDLVTRPKPAERAQLSRTAPCGQVRRGWQRARVRQGRDAARRRGVLQAGCSWPGEMRAQRGGTGKGGAEDRRRGLAARGKPRVPPWATLLNPGSKLFPAPARCPPAAGDAAGAATRRGRRAGRESPRWVFSEAQGVAGRASGSGGREARVRRPRGPAGSKAPPRCRC